MRTFVEVVGRAKTQKVMAHVSPAETKPCERKWLGGTCLIQTANENITEIVELGLFSDTDGGFPRLVINSVASPTYAATTAVSNLERSCR